MISKISTQKSTPLSLSLLLQPFLLLFPSLPLYSLSLSTLSLSLLTQSLP